MSGVTTVVGDAAFAWLVRAIVPPPGLRTSYQLAGINLSTGRIMFRTNLGYSDPAIAAGGGRLWMTTPNGQAGGQIVRIDLTTGKILSSIHLAAGACTHLAFGSGHLFAACRDGRSGGTEFWRINPVTEQAFQLTSPVRGFISSLVAAPGTLWYLVNDWRIRGLTNVKGNPQPVSVRDPNYYQTMPGGQGLVYGDGSLWALSGGAPSIRASAFSRPPSSTTATVTFSPSARAWSTAAAISVWDCWCVSGMARSLPLLADTAGARLAAGPGRPRHLRRRGPT